MIHKRLSDSRLPDVHLIGRKLFTEYNFPLQVIAVLLLVSTVGCVALSKRPTTSIAKKQSKKRVPTVATAAVEPEQTPKAKKAEDNA